ncbi:hypothetical protein [Siphonobacter sp. SORGH_AS_1065]|uniref:hypothetical protein n=1 Tax=Siphonobacter sp. SORGH_AS_1065 TaxID=3041795 RepID=UPI0027810651|nr:hypothetical protein [Siphonobacter sp. SORGH_AS_1065]MDQ1085673.1 hypothetical protein [Siphonobacter sp. SORGH_AS_1065]
MTNTGFEVGKYTRYKDKTGRVFLVIGQTTEYDEQRKESKGWATITLYNVTNRKMENAMPYDRFVHYVANGKLTRFSPMSHQPSKF